MQYYFPSPVISRPCDIKIPTVTVRSWETDAIYCSETLCSCTLLDKVSTGKMTSPIVHRERKACSQAAGQMHVIQPRSTGQNCFLTWKVWHALFFQHVTVALGSFLKKKMLFACQLGQWERLVQQEQRHKRKAKSASVGCNAIRFRWQWVSKWEWCEVSGIWIPQPNSLGCENNWQKHESVSKNTRGSDNPWPDGDGQGGMVVGGVGCHVYATSVRKWIQQH